VSLAKPDLHLDARRETVGDCAQLQSIQEPDEQREIQHCHQQIGFQGLTSFLLLVADRRGLPPPSSDGQVRSRQRGTCASKLASASRIVPHSNLCRTGRKPSCRGRGRARRAVGSPRTPAGRLLRDEHARNRIGGAAGRRGLPPRRPDQRAGRGDSPLGGEGRGFARGKAKDVGNCILPASDPAGRGCATKGFPGIIVREDEAHRREQRKRPGGADRDHSPSARAHDQANRRRDPRDLIQEAET
jgi:hypothetical protein